MQLHPPKFHLILNKCLFLKVNEWLYVAKIIVSLQFIELKYCNYEGDGSLSLVTR